MPLSESQIRAIERIEIMDDAMVQVLRSKSPAERFAIAAGMWRSARDMIRCMLRAEHPEWTDESVNREAARRLLLHGAGANIPQMSNAEVRDQTLPTGSQ